MTTSTKKEFDFVSTDLGAVRRQMRTYFEDYISEDLEYEEKIEDEDGEEWRRACSAWKEKIANWEGNEKFTTRASTADLVLGRPAKLVVVPVTLEAVVEWKQVSKGHRSRLKSAVKE